MLLHCRHLHGFLNIFQICISDTNPLTMKFDKIHNKKQARLFKSQYLEMLTKTHPPVIS